MRLHSLIRLPIVKSTGIWVTPSLLETAARTLAIAILAGIGSKQDFAAVSLALLLFSNVSLLQMGLPDALRLLLPRSWRRGQLNRYNEYINNSMTASVIITALSSAVIAAYFLQSSFSNLTIHAVLAYCLSAICFQIYTHIIIYYRFRHEFIVTSKIKLISAIIRIFLQLPMTLFFGAYGFIVSEVFVYLIPSTKYYRISLGNKCFVRLKSLKLMVRTAAPLFLIGLVGMAVATIDRWAIVSSSGTEVFAEYSFALYICAVIAIVPNQFASLFSQYVREASRNVLSDRNVQNAFVSLAIIAFLLVSGSSGALSIAINWVISVFYPNYIKVSEFINVAIALITGRIAMNMITSSFITRLRPYFVNLSHIMYILAFLITFFLIGRFQYFDVTAALYGAIVGLVAQFAFFVLVDSVFRESVRERLAFLASGIVLLCANMWLFGADRPPPLSAWSLAAFFTLAASFGLAYWLLTDKRGAATRIVLTREAGKSAPQREGNEQHGDK